MSETCPPHSPVPSAQLPTPFARVSPSLLQSTARPSSPHRKYGGHAQPPPRVPRALHAQLVVLAYKINADTLLHLTYP